MEPSVVALQTVVQSQRIESDAQETAADPVQTQLAESVKSLQHRVPLAYTSDAWHATSRRSMSSRSSACTAKLRTLNSPPIDSTLRTVVASATWSLWILTMLKTQWSTWTVDKWTDKKSQLRQFLTTQNRLECVEAQWGWDVVLRLCAIAGEEATWETAVMIADHQTDVTDAHRVAGKEA